MSRIIQELTKAPAGETAVAVLDRYAKVLATLAPVDAARRAIERMGPDAASTIEAFLQKSDFPLPNDLVEFYLEHGGVRLGSLRLFSAAQLLADENREAGERYPPRHGLLDFIQYAWGGRPEFEEAFSDEQAKQLNRDYWVIGMTHVDDNAHRYLYIDRAGRCSSLFFNQDYFKEEHLDDMLEMLRSSPATLDFNAAFVAEMQIEIDRISRN